MDLILFSTLADVHYDELERLMFFNARQVGVRTGLIQALDRFGTPKIEHHDNLLRVTLGACPDAQCLFAVSGTDGLGQLLGVVVYVRTSVDTLTIVHVAVADNIVTEENDEPLIVVRMIHELRHLAKSIRGVRWVHFLYPQGGQFRVPIHPSSART
jgi:hypothetical protein